MLCISAHICDKAHVPNHPFLAKMEGAFGFYLVFCLLLLHARGDCPSKQQNTDFIGDNKFEATTSTAAQCCALCSQSTDCHFWTFEGSQSKPGPCFLKETSSSPGGHPVPGRVSGHLGNHSGGGWPPPPPSPPSGPPYVPAGMYTCNSTADVGTCSLNGICTPHRNPATNTTCNCDSGWKGKRCEELDLVAANANGGYHFQLQGRNISSWGGPVLRDGNGMYGSRSLFLSLSSSTDPPLMLPMLPTHTPLVLGIQCFTGITCGLPK